MNDEQQRQFVACIALLAGMLHISGATVEQAAILLEMAGSAVLAGIFGMRAETPDADAIGAFAGAVVAAALRVAYSPKPLSQSGQLQA